MRVIWNLVTKTIRRQKPPEKGYPVKKSSDKKFLGKGRVKKVPG